MAKSRFSGMGDSEVFGGGSYFAPGLFKVEILECLVVASKRKRGVDYFVISAKVLESTVDSITVGKTCSQTIDLTNVMGLPNTKQFLAAACGCDSTDKEEMNEAIEKAFDMSVDQAGDFVTSEDQPLAGHVLCLECSEITTKAGQPFTKHWWMPAES